MKYIKKYWPLILLVIFMVFGGYLRLHGLSTNYSFWMDEDHVAVMVRQLNMQGVSYLFNFKSNSNLYQLGLYLIDSVSIRIFGFNELALRMPAVVFGILTIWAVYLLGRELFNRQTALVASFLTAFLQIQIVWSRQARPYQGLQLCYLLSAWLIYRMIKKTGNSKWNLIGFLVSGFIGASLHGLGALIIPIGLFILLLFGWRRYWKEIMVACLVTVILIILFRIDGLGMIKNIGSFNNLFYYRVFLTHNYLPLCIAAVIGAVAVLVTKKSQQLLLLCLFILPQIFVVTFILPQPFIRYIFIIMPFLYLLAGYGIIRTGEILDTRYNKLLSNIQYPISPRVLRPLISNIKYLVSLAVFIILIVSLVGSNKLTLTPREFYSLNNDMQEIPEVDWKAIYQVVKDNGGGTKTIPLITNWGTTPQWYLGDEANLYLARIKEGERTINTVVDLQKLISQYPSGIVVFDSWDNHLPPEILHYCRDTMKLIYEIDRLYPVQPRYWTVWVFRWGTTKGILDTR